MVVFAGLVWVARPDSDKSTISQLPSYSPPLVADEKNYDFGSISMAAGKVSHLFKVKNTRERPVVIEKVYTSCMCTTAVLMMENRRFGPFGMPGHGSIPRINQVINPGQEVLVEAIFNPAAHGPAGVGPIRRMLVLEEDTGQKVEMSFTANVTP